MSLNGYFGKPGSGKSYSVVEYVVIKALQKGRHVITNIPLEGDLLEQVYGGRVTQLPLDALDDPQLPELIPHGAVAIIDECWRRWPSGQKVSQCSKSDLQWLKEHRHRVDTEGNAMQVILVTQAPGDLASWVRQLIAHSFHMYKLEEVGAKGRFGIKVYSGCPVGERIPAKNLIRQAYGVYKPEIYQYYQSATQSQSFDVGDEAAMDKRFSLWGSGQMIAIMVSVPLMIVLGLYMLNGYISPKTQVPVKTEAAPLLVNPAPESLVNLPPPESLAGAAVEPVRQIISAPVGPQPSGLWRIAGTMKRPDEGLPPDAPQWPSMSGYGTSSDSTDAKAKLKLIEVAILVSLSGVRYFPLDKCTAFEDGINYECLVDGERVTPWTGKQGLTQSFPSSAAASPETGRTERSDVRPVQDVQQPLAQTAPRMTVVTDNSRLPRTLPPVARGEPQGAL